MNSQVEKARLFASLHVKGDPLILFNIWDAGSAKALEEVGAKAIATGSWSVAAAYGYPDREQLPLELAVANARRIAESVSLPVTIDFEGGYAQTPAQVQETVAQVIQAGAVGINFEDQVVGGDGLYSVEDQCARIRTIRQTAERLSVPLFINARTDIFIKTNPTEHTDHHLDKALARAHAYAEAGASGFFPVGLRNEQLIGRLCQACPLPVNILIMADTPSPKQLASLGVARISYGPGPYRQMIAALKEAGRNALSLD